MASVLVICRSYPPVLGGSEIEAQRVAAALRQRGHEVDVVCAGGPPMPPQRTWRDPYGTPVHMYGGGTGRGGDYSYALGVCRLLWKLRRRRPIAYFLMPGIHVVTGLLIARLLRYRVVMKFSGSNEVRKLQHSPVGRLELLLLRHWAERIMLLNEGMRDEAIEAGLPRERLLWMPNPVDTDDFAPCASMEKRRLRQQLGLPEDAPLLVYTGRLAPEKQLDVLLDAVAAVQKQRPEIALVLVGDGPLRDALQTKAHELGIAGAVTFAGRAAPMDIRRWLQAADMFVLTSALEGLPVSLLEAMSAGLPSVVSDIPATRQLITAGQHGYLAPPGDAATFAACVLRLFAEPETRERMGAEARKAVLGTYSTAHVIARYEELFAPHG